MNCDRCDLRLCNSERIDAPVGDSAAQLVSVINILCADVPEV